MANIAIFASGDGSNAQAIMEHFRYHPNHKVVLVLTNRADAGVISRAGAMGVPVRIFDKQALLDPNEVLAALLTAEVNLIVLAGFLWLMPNHVIEAFPNRILNIHPALLPQFGGKGMYGMRVHEAVRAAQVTETGITIHLVNAEYDKGKHLFQARCVVDEMDTPFSISDKVRRLELLHFATVIEGFLESAY